MEELDVVKDKSWFDNAACRGMDPEIFFPASGDAEGLRFALSICEACPVKQECLEINITEKLGVWGGTTGKSRAELRQNFEVKRECNWCFKPFVREQSNHVFCCDECRQKSRAHAKLRAAGKL